MRILVVDDEKIILADNVRMVRNVVTAIYPETDIVIDSTQDPLKALEMIDQYEYDVIFTDIDMPDLSGIELAKIMEKKEYNTNLIYVTGYPKYSLEAWSTKASSFLIKPIIQADVAKAFEKIINKKGLKK